LAPYDLVTAVKPGKTEKFAGRCFQDTEATLTKDWFSDDYTLEIQSSNKKDEECYDWYFVATFNRAHFVSVNKDET